MEGRRKECPAIRHVRAGVHFFPKPSAIVPCAGENATFRGAFRRSVFLGGVERNRLCHLVLSGFPPLILGEESPVAVAVVEERGEERAEGV